MRAKNINMDGPIWVFSPEQHKVLHYGRTREISLGPKAQEIVKGFLKANPQAFLFSPMEAREELDARKRESRKTPRWPSHMRAQERKRRRSKGGRKPGAHYTTISYGRCVRRACEVVGIEPWTPGRLRHSCATRLRREVGLEAARVALGHASALPTLIYAEADQEQVRGIMAKFG